ncbi:hypothetical protein ACVK1X_006273 [Pseudomonas sp. PvR086]
MEKAQPTPVQRPLTIQVSRSPKRVSNKLIELRNLSSVHLN